jgi:histidinol-phosphatase
MIGVSPDLDLALRLADAADSVTLARFRAADLKVTSKPDRTPVTDADTATEAQLRALLAAARPDDVILGEEEGGSVAVRGRGWVIDPIDGTKNFSRGVPVWGTLIGLTVEGVAEVGVASAPALGRRWWAARGAGAWTNDPDGTPRRIAVSGITDLADAYLTTTDARSFADIGKAQQWQDLAASVWETRAFGDFWMYCLLAEGVLDVAVDAVANPWDLAALIPIVTEAGGRLTDLAGSDGFAGGNGVATNGALHDVVVRALTP